MNYLNMGFFDNYPNTYYYPSNAYQFPHPGMLNYNIPYFPQQFLPQEQHTQQTQQQTHAQHK